MNNNSNNPGRSIGAPTSFVNPGAMVQSTHVNHQPPQLLSQSQPQTQGGPAFPGHFQLSETQARVLGNTQYAQAAHAQFQSHIKSTNHSVAQLQNSNSANVGVQPPPVPTPSSSSAKKTSYKPPSRPSGGSSNANMASLFKTMELAPAVRRKKRKLLEKEIPDKVVPVLPESVIYTQLLEFEARMDAAMARKKMDIQESLKNPPRVRKTLRVYVFNTFENQLQGSNERKNAEPPSWSLKIIGRILEDGKDPVLTGIDPETISKILILLQENYNILGPEPLSR
ncbi:SWI/SNF COMPLEX COMPONENT SNF12-like protein ISOFORM X1 [Salix purpurea]|uniref:SWI/SNF COMPLEX COMPONENT SNF12-like protein ISOFORM X1 n=1 Tax=Salix purpurea TaxID=77065 RepID=A0A9Q0W5H1_SALPP|nr:SWI/SNF COMPLEX COMPONENT SNF12-like protein ISOFORM X1 [Salix purpurea]